MIRNSFASKVFTLRIVFLPNASFASNLCTVTYPCFVLSHIPKDSSVLHSSFFTRSMVFTHMCKAQLPFALLSETFLTIRQNSLYVTVCMIVRTFYQGYFIHSLSTLYYYNAPSLTPRLTGDYRDRTCTGKCGPALLDTPHRKRASVCTDTPCHFILILRSGMLNFP